MFFLIISIICSVSVGVLFKKIKPDFYESFLIISINYLISIVLSWFLFEPQLNNISLNYWIILPLILLMPSIFIILNLSIKKSGIIKTDIAQRLSLVIPIFSSFLLFGESISLLKWFGLILGFLAVFLMLSRSEKNIKSNSCYLAIVFFGYGIIDVLFKQIALQKSHPYTTYLFLVFVGCLLVSILFSFFIKKRVKKIDFSVIIYGIILGVLNFSNIYFYLKAHKIFSSEPSTVFAMMNFGVISLATILGVFIFKEKLSKKNILGIAIAVVAIIFVLISQFKIY